MKKNVKMKYWTNLMYCGCGGNAGGKTSIELDDAELELFKASIKPAKKGRDMLTYFKENLSEELAEKICNAITEDFKRKMAADAISEVGSDCFPNLSSKEYDEMSLDELVDILVGETDYSDLDYTIVDIEIV